MQIANIFPEWQWDISSLWSLLIRGLETSTGPFSTYNWARGNVSEQPRGTWPSYKYAHSISEGCWAHQGAPEELLWDLGFLWPFYKPYRYPGESVRAAGKRMQATFCKTFFSHLRKYPWGRFHVLIRMALPKLNFIKTDYEVLCLWLKKC